ncbi:hypothetical protein RDWZM_000415 [Blomia tropicalis]|uniref:Fatty acid desaturase domain-containing protein n=1 Tax=Blomia tropicalis TaxID=40697 RepID=A0A9Q0MDQ1_BLOTA|nr:hypothetical protein RDWZM_000415 [Blomia tropicalis]
MVTTIGTLSTNEHLGDNHSKIHPNQTEYKHKMKKTSNTINGNDTVRYRKEITYQLYETDTEQVVDVIDNDEQLKHSTSSDQENRNVIDSNVKNVKRKYEYVWLNIIVMASLHVAALYGLTLIPYAHRATIVWAYLLLLLGSIGVQAGAHRLWAHRTYKANFGARLFLSLCHVVALQNDVYEWSRDHRAHHKFADTDGDPHDSTKGFFFSHVGWLLVRKHSEVKRRGKTLDMSDLERDGIVMFQRRWYIPMVALFWGLIPMAIPVLCWNELPFNSIFICIFSRYVIALNLTWCVNSWAHMFGNRPYDKRLFAVEASIRHLLMGEGFHNYHHTFPWDYSASELGSMDVFNPATAVIDFFHWMGWAWDLKKVSPAMIEKRKKSTGDSVWYHKRNTSFYEWTTGTFTILSPLAFGLYLNYVLSG